MMSFLDLSSDPSPQGSGRKQSSEPKGASTGEGGENRRKFIGVKFNCCSVYVQIYMNKDGTGYEGRCPKCLRPVKFKIGTGGTNQRFFEAY